MPITHSLTQPKGDVIALHHDKNMTWQWRCWQIWWVTVCATTSPLLPKDNGEAVKIRTVLLLHRATSNAKCSKEAWRTGSRWRWLCLDMAARRHPPCCRTPSSPPRAAPKIKLNLTFIQESNETSYLPPLVRGVFSCFAGIVNITRGRSCVCMCVCARCCLLSPPASPPRHSAAHRTDTLPGCPN